MENMNPSTATPSSAVKYSSFNVPLDSIYLELMQTMCISIGNLIKIEERCYNICNIVQIFRCTWFSWKLCKHRNLLLSLDCMLRSFRVIWSPMEMKLKKLVLFISKRSAIKYVLFFCQINFKFHFWNATKHKWLRLSWNQPCKRIMNYYIKWTLPVWPLLKNSPSAITSHQFVEKWIESTKVELGGANFPFLNLKSIGDCLWPLPHTSYPSRDPHVLRPYKLF